MTTDYGQKETELLWISDSLRGYVLNPGRETYTTITPSPIAGNDSARAAIIKTNETKKILGHVCTKYVIRQADPKIQLSQS